MKKIVFLAALAFSAAAFAQTVKIGVKAGYLYNSPTKHFAPIVEVKGGSGFYGGVNLEFPISDKFAIQGEVGYAGESFNTVIPDSSSAGIPTDFKDNRLTVPVMAKYYAIPNLALLAGPYFSTRLSSSMSVGPETIHDSQNFINIGTKLLDFGLTAGGEYTLYEGLFIEARYNLGLMGKTNNMFKDMGAQDYKNSSVQVGLGYKF